MIYIVLIECWGSTMLMVAYSHLFLHWLNILIQIRYSISHPYKFLQIHSLLKQICDWNDFFIFLENITFLACLFRFRINMTFSIDMPIQILFSNLTLIHKLKLKIRGYNILIKLENLKGMRHVQYSCRSRWRTVSYLAVLGQ